MSIHFENQIPLKATGTALLTDCPAGSVERSLTMSTVCSVDITADGPLSTQTTGNVRQRVMTNIVLTRTIIKMSVSATPRWQLP